MTCYYVAKELHSGESGSHAKPMSWSIIDNLIYSFELSEVCLDDK